MIAARLFLSVWFLAELAAGASAQTVTLDISGETRGQALAQLLPEGSAEIEWKNPALADQPVEGHFEGSQTQVLKDILAPADFAAVYAQDGDGLKIVRLIVLDKETAATGPAQVTPVVEPQTTPAQLQRSLRQRQQQQALPGRQRSRAVSGQSLPSDARLPPGLRRHPLIPGQQPPGGTVQ